MSCAHGYPWLSLPSGSRFECFSVAIRGYPWLSSWLFLLRGYLFSRAWLFLVDFVAIRGYPWLSVAIVMKMSRVAIFFCMAIYQICDKTQWFRHKKIATKIAVRKNSRAFKVSQIPIEKIAVRAWLFLSTSISLDIPGYPGIHRDILGYPGISKDILECQKISRNISGYPSNSTVK